MKGKQVFLKMDDTNVQTLCAQQFGGVLLIHQLQAIQGKVIDAITVQIKQFILLQKFLMLIFSDVVHVEVRSLKRNFDPTNKCNLELNSPNKQYQMYLPWL